LIFHLENEIKKDFFLEQNLGFVLLFTALRRTVFFSVFCAEVDLVYLLRAKRWVGTKINLVLLCLVQKCICNIFQGKMLQMHFCTSKM